VQKFGCHKNFSVRSLFFLENEEISAASPCGFLIGIYMFYEHWSTETFGKREDSEKNLLIKSFVLM
jgi:hypothetical protein